MITATLLRVKSHCIPFTSCVVYKGVVPVLEWDAPVSKVSVGARKLWVYEEQGHVVAEWLPQQTGMYPQGCGDTVLEAIGDLCVWDGVVEIAEPCEVVDRRWSIAQSAPDRR